MVFLLPSSCRFIVTSVAILSLSGCANPPTADAQDTVSSRAETMAEATEIDTFIAEASQRFRIPERWIRAVMRAESAGDDRAVSSAGAMGLMQIMPDTWTELSAAHGLGADPFDRRENILAGTAYLRQMYDRFGAPGFLAAYNAGPGRYAEHLRTGRTLPRETRRYVAALSQELGFSNAAPLQPTSTASVDRWEVAPLFTPVSLPREPQRSRGPDRRTASVQKTDEPSQSLQESTPKNALFVPRTKDSDR